LNCYLNIELDNRNLSSAVGGVIASKPRATPTAVKLLFVFILFARQACCRDRWRPVPTILLIPSPRFCIFINIGQRTVDAEKHDGQFTPDTPQEITENYKEEDGESASRYLA